jgi:DNA processing protein
MKAAKWLALASAPGIGGATIRELLQRFGDLDAILSASDAQLLAIPRVTPAAVSHLRRISLEQLATKLAAWGDEEIQVLTWDDATYPEILRSIASPPPILFRQGQMVPRDRQSVAVVGTRQPTPSGSEIAHLIAYELASRGLTVISGLAIGIDTAAHRGALRARGGRTIAVLGSGLCAIHPQSNTSLAKRITKRGALLSEVTPNTVVERGHLLARNRITSGLAQAVIVVESGARGGAMVTAEKARRQDRLLLALPNSAGTDILIGEGAKALRPDHTDWDDLAEQISSHRSQAPASVIQLGLF